MKKSNMVVVVLVGSAMAANALAHEGAMGIVKDRMDAMSNLGRSVKVIAEMVRGRTAFSAMEVRNSAMVIKSHSGSALTDLFPDSSFEEPSKAREEIWSNWDEFSELASRMEMLAMGLDLAADNGLMGGKSAKVIDMPRRTNGEPNMDALAKMPVDGIFMMIAKTCRTCHEKFRSGNN